MYVIELEMKSLTNFNRVEKLTLDHFVEFKVSSPALDLVVSQQSKIKKFPLKIAYFVFS
jgi:hypothetical protein